MFQVLSYHKDGVTCTMLTKDFRKALRVVREIDDLSYVFNFNGSVTITYLTTEGAYKPNGKPKESHSGSQQLIYLQIKTVDGWKIEWHTTQEGQARLEKYGEL